MRISQMSVNLLDSMGTDLSVVDAARVSFSKTSEWEQVPFEMAESRPDGTFPTRLRKEDAKLIAYLASHQHWTPFGHCFATFRVKAPIFVARQLVKHTVGLCWNEVSRRYVDNEPEFWFPDTWRVRPDGSIKQGSGDKHVAASMWDVAMREATNHALKRYLIAIEDGVAPEQARMVLPQNTMTEWIWSGSLAAWARVCKLRLDNHAQAETAEVARMIAEEMASLFPTSWGELMK